MPITQDRLIKLVAHADTLLGAFDDLKAQTRDLDIPSAIAQSNALIEHTNDIAMQRTLKGLSAKLSQLYYLFTDIELPPALRDNITEERTHFKAAKRANETMASYMKYKRSAEKSMAAAKQQIPSFFQPEGVSTAAPQAEEAEVNDPVFARVQEQLHKKFWPSQAQAGVVSTRPAKAQETIEATPLNNINRNQEGETIEEIRMRESKYAPGITATSAPTNEEQNKIGISSPDQDVL